MGYNLTIGEANLDYDASDLRIRIRAKFATHPDAPTHDDYVGNGNSRSPGYGAWSEFCKEAGITELFYGTGWSREERRYKECSESFHRETPLLANHPGAQPICQGDLDYVRQARIRREQTNGGKEPGFWDDDNRDNGKDPQLARLLWLEFWFDWALKNCQMPIMENS